MKNPPYLSHGPSGRYDPFNYVVPSSAGKFVFGGYIPPEMSGGQWVYQSYKYGYPVPPSQGIPQYQILVYPYMGHMGGVYYPTSQGHGIYHNHPYVKQPFQGVWN